MQYQYAKAWRRLCGFVRHAEAAIQIVRLGPFGLSQLYAISDALGKSNYHLSQSVIVRVLHAPMIWY